MARFDKFAIITILYIEYFMVALWNGARKTTRLRGALEDLAGVC